MSNIYKKGLDRKYQLYLPPSLDEYVGEDNIVRVIDLYVENLDMIELGFSNAELNVIQGQPAFHPSLLLKIYIYTYLNKIRSSRMIEQEIKRNVELMWLTQGLTPGYKTVANFRKDNSKPLQKIFKEFVLLIKNIDLISGDVMIDGAYLRANASKNETITKKDTEASLKRVENAIEKSLISLDSEDEIDEKLIKQNKNIEELNRQEEIKKENIEKLKQEEKTKQELLKKLNDKKKVLEENLALLKNQNQYNKTDPDSSVMVKPAHNLVAYNTQISVDTKFKFIVATDVSTKGNDKQELHKMAKMSKENLELDKIKAGADSGYYSESEIKKCKDDNIEPFTPIPKTKKADDKKDKFTKEDFTYNKEEDNYTCPNNQQLKKTNSPQKKNDKINYIYKTTTAMCKDCPLKEKCITGKTQYKRIYRWEHEEVIEKFKEDMQSDEAKKIIKQRGSIVEHPFGTIKRTLGWDHYLVRNKEKVSGENALIMFNYNFKRLFNIIGIVLFMKLILAAKEGNIEEIKREIAEQIAISFEKLLYLVKFLLMSRNISFSYKYSCLRVG
jgi:transposase